MFFKCVEEERKSFGRARVNMRPPIRFRVLKKNVLFPFPLLNYYLIFRIEIKDWHACASAQGTSWQKSLKLERNQFSLDDEREIQQSFGAVIATRRAI